MPQLPKKNTLDYNPDALINASKKITAIALERMKNPIEDADAPTLSVMNATKQLEDNLAKIEDLAGSFSSVLLRIQNLSSKPVGRGRVKKMKGEMKGGVKSALEIARENDANEAREFQRRLEMDRQRFSRFVADDDRNSQAISRKEDVIDDESAFVPPDLRSISSGNSAPYSRSDIRSDIGTVGDETEYSSIVSGFSKPSKSSKSSLTTPGGYDDDSYDSSFFGSPPIGEADRVGREGADWTSLIFTLIQLVRRMDIIVASRIKPITSKLSQQQVQKLTDIYQIVFNSYNDLIEPFGRRVFTGEKFRDPITKVLRNPNPNVIQDYRYNLDITQNVIAMNEYGDEILNTFNTERKKLLLDLTVVINSWKQNTPTGQQSSFNEIVESDFNKTMKQNKALYEANEASKLENDSGVFYANPPSEMTGEGRSLKKPVAKKKTGRMTMIGCGRNFYGEVINDTADIPTIWSGVRDCPTKYLL